MLRVLLGVIILISFTSQIYAHEIAVLIPGLSYHIGANSSNPAYQEAPRRLDKNGALVVNPGVGLIYDTRDKEKNSGFSWTALGLIFQDCDDRSAYVVGVGGRYRHYFNEKFSIDGDLYLSLYSAQDWETSEYNNSIVPFPSLGVNYHLDDVSIGVRTTFSPKNTKHSSTGGFSILFGYLSIGYAF